MEVSVETCWKSLNKIHEELCGDKVEILKTEDSDVVILADGMGSGVKANILATLTSKILRTMFQKGAPIEQGVETIARTLPICQVRQVAYSTFSILQIFHNGEAYLVEYDNPGCIFVRDGKLMDIPYTVREIEGKKIIVLPLDITKQEDLEAYKKMLAKEHPWAEFRLDVGKHGGLHREMYQGYTFGQASGSDAVPGLRRPVYAETGRRYNSGGSKSH